VEEIFPTWKIGHIVVCEKTGIQILAREEQAQGKAGLAVEPEKGTETGKTEVRGAKNEVATTFLAWGTVVDRRLERPAKTRNGRNIGLAVV
jgi:hypothetical protein